MFHGLSNTTEVFDLELQQWTSFPSMSVDRVGCAAVAVGKFILVIGGGTSGVVEVFDTETQTWLPALVWTSFPQRGLFVWLG
mmetsp:Transcript_9968/g.23067  ORF Transcript_9968/g.23067 Transcript_9968/m.23067 type:complete len:82 (+) Transcript_9968:333-578(+)